MMVIAWYPHPMTGARGDYSLSCLSLSLLSMEWYVPQELLGLRIHVYRCRVPRNNLSLKLIMAWFGSTTPAIQKQKIIIIICTIILIGSPSWVQDYYLKPVKISHGMVWFNQFYVFRYWISTKYVSDELSLLSLRFVQPGIQNPDSWVPVKITRTLLWQEKRDSVKSRVLKIQYHKNVKIRLYRFPFNTTKL